jgi:hypothetical protein
LNYSEALNQSNASFSTSVTQERQTRHVHRILYVSTVSWVNLTITILPDPTDELLLKQQAGPPNISHLFNLVLDWREHFRKKSWTDFKVVAISMHCFFDLLYYILDFLVFKRVTPPHAQGPYMSFCFTWLR